MNRVQDREREREREMGMTPWLEDLVPFAAMVMVECLDVGLTTLSKAAMTKGMNHYVFVVYSNALATIIFLPLFIFQRKKTPPPLSFSLLSKFFLLSFAGITLLQNCVFAGVSYSSPTLGSAMSNLAPAFTFILAVFFRMEKLDLRCSKGQIKVMGTLVSISGALVIIIYKGPAILALLSHSGQNTSYPLNPSSAPKILRATSNWIEGSLFLVVASLSFSIWNIGQAAILERYPSKITILFYYYFFGTIQCALLTLIVGEDSSIWALTPDIELISVLYSGICGSAVVFSVLTWCIKMKGPVFAAMFKPLGIAIAAFLGAIFLGDTFYTGSVIGAILIVIGFYGVIWAQSVEGKAENHGVANGLQQASPQTPLLESQTHV
ncbi:WAT1-related protein At4g15540-like isoform X1 [Humulus lupulus]|uniref:WAT1-related protein At4g15540-like isoform X1 n=1 Tax=Humulus lupulus TaxID=3486 RepID=UPI002B4184F0|nr:WAT1-related protein At4g15540-like isoform X1 [Humulus lupulus]